MKAGGVSMNLYNSSVQEEIGFKMRRFDIGLGFGANIDWQKFCFGFSFDGGLVNMIKNVKVNINDWSNIKSHNVSAAITVGYKF